MIKTVTLRRLTAAEVSFELRMQQDDTPLRRNVMASGDEAADEEAEKWVKDQLANGNDWAWARVTVIATYRSFEGRDSLSCCSYESEGAFKADPYYQSLCEEALENLNNNIAEHFEDLKDLIQTKHCEDPT